MNTSPEVKEIIAALLKAQGAIEPPKKDAQGQARGAKYPYASLNSVLNAVSAPLAANGISIVQAPTVTDTGFVLATRLLHISGQWMEATYMLPLDGTPQELGSALTYARRYSLCGLLSIAPEDDDDGAEASRPKAQKQAPPTPIRPAAVTASVATQAPLTSHATPGDDSLVHFLDGWKLKCPVHNLPWQEGQQGHWHPLTPTGICQRTPMLAPLIKERLEAGAKAMGMDGKAINEWLKAGGGKTWSAMNTDEKIGAMEVLERDAKAKAGDIKSIVGGGKPA